MLKTVGSICRRLATFYSRSRKGRWCKGETSGHFIQVLQYGLQALFLGQH